MWLGVTMTPKGLEPLATSREEIAELLERFATALDDAHVVAQSVDGRYVDAYVAGFLLAEVAVRASGYRVKGGDNHLDTLRSVPRLMGSDVQSGVDALEAARKRRNATMYDAGGLVDEGDVSALIQRVVMLAQQVRDWLSQEHPELGQ